MTPPKKKEFIIMEKDTGHIIREGDGRHSDITSIWNFMGFTAPDIFKIFLQFGAAVVFMTCWYNDDKTFKDFMADQGILNKHLLECNDNRDKWASLKNGHIFECGKPIDGWTPNRGNLNEKNS